LTDTT